MTIITAAGEDLVSLTAGIELFDGVSMDRLQPSNVEELLDMPVKLGTDLPEGLRLSHDDGSTVQVRTVRKYRLAVDAGYVAMTGFEIKMGSFFVTTSGVLAALAACRPSSSSFIARRASACVTSISCRHRC